jgi:hypothetical protein
MKNFFIFIAVCVGISSPFLALWIQDPLFFLHVPYVKGILTSARFFKTLDIKAELGPQLSQEATISLPGDAQFESVTSRWTLWSPPSYRAYVEIGSEEDVEKIVSRHPTTA